MTNITRIDYCILGLLRPQPLSGYAIRKIFETSAMGNFSSSPGTVYPALKRLEANGMIEKKPASKDAPEGRLVFGITAKGIKTIDRWIFEPLTETEVAKNLNDILLRFAFMPEDTPKKDRLKFLRSFQKLLKQYVQSLEDYHTRQAGAMPLNGRLAFEHGIASYKASLKWVTSIVK